MVRRRRNGPLSAAQVAWLNSPEFKARRLDGLRKANELWKRRPRCGATAKHTGQPCQKPALANGKCRYHGGATPKGKDWHKAQLANPGASIEKVSKKLAELERRRKRIARRVAAMPADERARYEAWQASHRPGGPSERQYARQNWDMRARLMQERPPATTTPEMQELEAEIAAVKTLLAGLRARQEEDQPQTVLERANE